MTEDECRAVEQKCVEEVREALKVITSGNQFDAFGNMTSDLQKALEMVEGLDLFWICDPMIKLAKNEEKSANEDICV